jgi:hypothetical protein
LRLKKIKTSSKADLDEAKRLLKQLLLKMGLSDEPDSLEQIERELGGLDPGNTVGVSKTQARNRRA